MLGVIWEPICGQLEAACTKQTTFLKLVYEVCRFGYEVCRSGWESLKFQLKCSEIDGDFLKFWFLGTSAQESVPLVGYSPATYRLLAGFSLCVATQKVLAKR